MSGLFFLLGIALGFIGTTTGGSALVLIPMMVSMGVPTHAAIAQARFATLGTMASGIGLYHKQKKVDYTIAFFSSIFGITGAILGSLTLIDLPETSLKGIIGAITISCACLNLLKRKHVGAFETTPLRRIVGYLLFFVVGFVGGIFGAQAILATYVLIFFFNKSMTESIGTRKVVGLVISIVSLLIYGMNDLIDWWQSFIILSGTLIGGTFGSSYTLKMGDQWAEKIFNIAILVLGLTLLI